MKLLIFPLLTLAGLLSAQAGPRDWPQAGGPNGSWAVEAGSVPVEWSAVKNEQILWRTQLPEQGQSGIAVWGERVFLTTYKPEADKPPTGRDLSGIAWTPGQAGCCGR